MIGKIKRALDWERQDTEDMAWILSVGAVIILGVMLS